MSVTYRCENENRLVAVRNHATLNGIEWLEVLDGLAPAGSPRQRTLLVHFVKVIADPFDGNNVRIDVPANADAVGVEWAGIANDADDLLAAGRISVAERDYFVTLSDADQVLVVRANGTGDFSTYTLRVVSATDDEAPPAGIDVRLDRVEFSFKVECPNPFDCRDDDAEAAGPAAKPAIDYLAKDYASFRQLMLDRLGVTLSAWQDDSAADLVLTLVELLAYVGDHLSYAQDAVATEAYLGTARRRASVRRHARLLDYRVHEGVNARCWVHVRAAATTSTLAEGTELRTAGNPPIVFLTMHDAELRSAHNEIEFYTWSDDACCLPKGSTSATLLDAGGLQLEVGDALLLEEVRSPDPEAWPDPSHRHIVRLTAVGDSEEDELTVGSGTTRHVVEIAWHEDDALPFDLHVSPVLDAGGQLRPVAYARGNMVLADEGERVTDQNLEPEELPESRERPRLLRTSVVHAQGYDHDAAIAASAAAALTQDARAAVAAVTLNDGSTTWNPRYDLLGSDRFAPEFVLEPESDGRAYVRFGDGVFGQKPTAGTRFTASYRIGGGTAGNVGTGAIRSFDRALLTDVESVRNPLPAAGGADPESFDEVRLAAPQAFRRQERAVTEADYAEVAERLSGVERAHARYRWTGSWLTVYLSIDRTGGEPVRSDPEFLATVEAHLERYRMAGFDVEIGDPIYVPLDVEIGVCVADGYFRAHVHAALLEELGNGLLDDGRAGAFHPDAFTFGQSVYLSQLYDRALAVVGVASIEVTKFQRYGKAADGELEDGELKVADLEIVRLDNDRNAPENGVLTFELAGGI